MSTVDGNAVLFSSPGNVSAVRQQELTTFERIVIIRTFETLRKSGAGDVCLIHRGHAYERLLRSRRVSLEVVRRWLFRHECVGFEREVIKLHLSSSNDIAKEMQATMLSFVVTSHLLSRNLPHTETLSPKRAKPRNAF